jgi:hypothetical protein
LSAGNNFQDVDLNCRDGRVARIFLAQQVGAIDSIARLFSVIPTGVEESLTISVCSVPVCGGNS